MRFNAKAAELQDPALSGWHAYARLGTNRANTCSSRRAGSVWVGCADKNSSSVGAWRTSGTRDVSCAMCGGPGLWKPSSFVPGSCSEKGSADLDAPTTLVKEHGYLPILPPCWEARAWR